MPFQNVPRHERRAVIAGVRLSLVCRCLNIVNKIQLLHNANQILNERTECCRSEQIDVLCAG